MSVEHVVVHPGMPESDLFYPSGEVLVAHPRSLPIFIYLIDNLEDVCFPTNSLGFYFLGNLHVHVKFNVGLIKGHNKTHLACALSIGYGQE